ncbi:MAG: nuclear transport factor 2 family protein [Brevundimonas sp.]|nr:MAG: nuclear transport factor 2 family protein [Brevundimonas sp.]
MSLELPTPIAAYVDANTRLDVDGMMKPFTADAVVLDDGGRFEGHVAIRGMLQHSVDVYKAVFTPDALRHENGQVVIEGPAHGDFKGSPVRFTYRFELDGDSIKALEITA